MVTITFLYNNLHFLVYIYKLQMKTNHLPLQIKVPHITHTWKEIQPSVKGGITEEVQSVTNTFFDRIKIPNIIRFSEIIKYRISNTIWY